MKADSTSDRRDGAGRPPRPGRPGTPPSGGRTGRLGRRGFVQGLLLLTASVGLAACGAPAPAPAERPSDGMAEAEPTATAVPRPPQPATGEPTTAAAPLAAGSPVAVAPAAPPAEVAVGAIVSLSGRFSREGALMRAGYEAWAEAVQQGGGMRVGSARRALRLTFADDESEPLNGGRQAERLAAAEGVRLWLGPYSSPITTSVGTVADRVNALLVAPDASAAPLFRRGLRRLIAVPPPDDRLFHGFADLAATVTPRAEPIGILIADEPTHAAAVAGFRERAEALGLDPPQVELTSLGSRDVTYQLSKLAEHQPRLVILATEQGQTARFAPTLRELVPFATMRAIVPLPEPATPTGRRDLLYDGAITVDSWWPTIQSTGPVLGSASEFAARFRRLHGYDPEPRCAAAAAAGLALQLAVEQAGTVDPGAVREAFATLDITTFWGRMAWDVTGRNRVAVPPVLQQQGDAVVAVYPRAVAGGRLRYPLAGWPRS